MRRNRGILNEEQETKRMLYIAGGVLIVAIIAFIITFVVYSNILENDKQLADINSKKITELSLLNNEFEQASTSIGKSVNEVKDNMANNVTNEAVENTAQDDTKIAINTSNMEKTNTVIETNNNTTVEKQEKEEEKDPSFQNPVEGEIMKEFAKDKLLYSETLQEWVTHTGIDIKADKTTVVKAAEEGVIKSIKNDPRYGITVVIEHSKGFSSVYANLLTAEFVKEGEKVSKGQTIGTVGNTAVFEIADDYHLHFEILKDGENVDPSLYIK